MQKSATMAQLAEHVIGNDEVPGPNPGSSSNTKSTLRRAFCVGERCVPLALGVPGESRTRFVGKGAERDVWLRQVMYADASDVPAGVGGFAEHITSLRPPGATSLLPQGEYIICRKAAYFTSRSFLSPLHTSPLYPSS